MPDELESATTRSKTHSNNPRAMPKELRNLLAFLLTVFMIMCIVSTVLFAMRAEYPQAALYAVSFLIYGILARGIFRGKRLAWQYGRLTTGFAMVIWTPVTVLMTLGVVATFSALIARLEPWQLLVPLASAWIGLVVLYAFFFALGQKSALEFFRLLCPNCGRRGVAADFHFQKVKCKACTERW